MPTLITASTTLTSETDVIVDASARDIIITLAFADVSPPKLKLKRRDQSLFNVIIVPQGADTLFSPYGSTKAVRVDASRTFYLSSNADTSWSYVSTPPTIEQDEDEAGPGGGVSFVSGTAHRITAVPTTGHVVVDIAGDYVGQTSITTLGILTTSPTAGIALEAHNRVRIADPTNTYAGALFAGSSGGLIAFHVGSDSDVPLAFFAHDSAPLAVLTQAGHWGLGTTTPNLAGFATTTQTIAGAEGGVLELETTHLDASVSGHRVGAIAFEIKANSGVGNVQAAGIQAVATDGGGSGLRGAYLAFYTTNAGAGALERIRISDSGLVGIGDDPALFGAQLDVMTSAVDAAAYFMRNNANVDSVTVEPNNGSGFNKMFSDWQGAHGPSLPLALGTLEDSTTLVLFQRRAGVGGSVASESPDAALTVSWNTSVLSPGLTAASGYMMRAASLDGVKTVVAVEAYGAAPHLEFLAARGTAAAPLTLGADDLIGAIDWGGFAAVTGWTPLPGQASIDVFAREVWSLTDRSTYLTISTTLHGATSPTEVVRVTSNSDGGLLVGIGTAAPTAMLDVAGNARVGGNLRVDSYASVGTTHSYGQVTVDDGGAFLRDGSWNDAIDVTTHGANDYPALFFSGQANDRTSAIVWTASTSGNDDKQIGAAIFPVFGNTFGSPSGGAHLRFYTNDSIGNHSYAERVRITETGAVGIGRTTPSGKLDVAGDVYFAGFIQLGPGSASGVSPGGSARVIYNEVTNKIQVSKNGAAYVDVI